MLGFFVYWFWVFFGIVSIIICRNIFEDKYNNGYAIKFPGWMYLVVFIILCIPLINIVTAISVPIFYNDFGHIKKPIKKWFNNLWIVRILINEY